MSRAKLIVGLAIAVLALSALFIVPAMTFAAPGHPGERAVVRPDTPTTFYAGFSGTITKGQKGSPIVGGLTLEIRHSGDFWGKFVAPSKTYINVNGKITSSGAITINFLGSGAPFLTGQGQIHNAGLTTGTFQLLNKGNAVSSGVWSILQNAGPSNTLAMAFYGHVTSGPDTKLNITGPIVLNATSLKTGVTVSGSINLSDGTILLVRANIDRTNHIEVNLGVGLPRLHIIGTGDSFYNGGMKDRGYAGAFVGPREHDAGNWQSIYFVLTQH